MVKKITAEKKLYFLEDIVKNKFAVILWIFVLLLLLLFVSSMEYEVDSFDTGYVNYFYYVAMFFFVMIFLWFSFIFKTSEEEVESSSFFEGFFGGINRKFMVILGIVFLIMLFICFVAIYFQGQILDNYFADSINVSENNFFNFEAENMQVFSTALEVIVQDNNIKQTYIERNRNSLMKHVQPLYLDLKDKHSITLFNFIEPDGTYFLSLGRESFFGDKNEGDIFLDAKENQRVASGIELNKDTYAFRVIAPYYDGSQLIGYIELAQEVDLFLDFVRKKDVGDFSIAVDKDFLNEEYWINYVENNGFRNSWNDFEKYVLIGSTMRGVLPCFSDENVNIASRETIFIGDIKVDEKSFICGGFPLTDGLGHTYGAVFSFIDVTEDMNFMSRVTLVIFVILFFAVLVLIAIFFYVSKKISSPIAKLNIAIKEIGRKNFKTRVNVNTGDELQKLGRTFNSAVGVLEKMDRENKQLEKAKTEFLSITSHELRSPMTPMQAQLQMLLGDYYGKLNAAQKNAIEIVARNTKRLDNIIVDFLEISRIEAARLKFRFVKENPINTINRLVKEMEGFMPEKKIKIITKLGKLPVIEHDPDRLGQVLRNLLNNAIKFSKPGTSVTISSNVRGKVIQFRVSDQGIGISPEAQQRIFEPFYQAEQTIYREHQGTGLGLAIVRGIVESQRGEIWVESKEGVGSNFYFTLPFEPVKEIGPIKILFSEKENVTMKIKTIFNEILGPMGANEFENLKRMKQLGEKDLIDYVGGLVDKGILTLENGEIFKVKIHNIFKEAWGASGKKEE